MKMRSLFQIFILCLAAALFFGCADSSTKGAMKNIDSNVTLNISGNHGPVNVYPGLDVAANAGNTDQDTKNSSNVDPKTTANAGWNGGSASGQMDAAGAIAEVAGEYLKDVSKNDSDNSENEQVLKTEKSGSDEVDNVSKISSKN